MTKEQEAWQAVQDEGTGLAAWQSSSFYEAALQVEKDCYFIALWGGVYRQQWIEIFRERHESRIATPQKSGIIH